VFETLFQYPAIVARRRIGQFAEARERFLNHCADQGLARATLQHAQRLLVVAERIDITIGEAIQSSAIEAAADRWAREQHQRQRGAQPAVVAHTLRSNGHGLAPTSAKSRFRCPHWLQNGLAPTALGTPRPHTCAMIRH
jgi:hypothetical protein